ncbi:MAG: pyrroline-5-carboxylate reductase [Clostridia bacterium]|nr:pyrroline-5-carboxylate reductase [Clostridia bacterium]
MNKKIGFIGAGNMGGAIIGGIVRSEILSAKNIFVFDKNAEAAQKLNSEYGVNVCASVVDAVKTDIVFLAVKPNVIYTVIEEIKDCLSKDTVIVSIAAGQSIQKLTDAFDIHDIKLIRVMPNTPALVGEAMSALSLNAEMQKEENKEAVSDVVSLLGSCGKAEIVSEKLMDTVTGVSGSSPAYIFMLIEAMADAAVLGGMPRAQAYTFAAQSVLGSAKMVLETGKHPAELKDMVCSPAGTTIEAVKVLEDKNFRGTVIDAIDACIEKSKNL